LYRRKLQAGSLHFYFSGALQFFISFSRLSQLCWRQLPLFIRAIRALTLTGRLAAVKNCSLQFIERSEFRQLLQNEIKNWRVKRRLGKMKTACLFVSTKN